MLVTTLTKRMAEELTELLRRASASGCATCTRDVQTIERIEILRDLRNGDFDVLVGINLLREGLDLPEVSLVAILDADKEGFLRSARSLIQTIGRAARNVRGTVILYADKRDRLDARGDRRDGPPPRSAARVQPEERHHARRTVESAITTLSRRASTRPTT